MKVCSKHEQAYETACPWCEPSAPPWGTTHEQACAWIDQRFEAKMRECGVEPLPLVSRQHVEDTAARVAELTARIQKGQDLANALDAAMTRERPILAWQGTMRFQEPHKAGAFVAALEAEYEAARAQVRADMEQRVFGGALTSGPEEEGEDCDCCRGSCSPDDCFCD